MVEEKVREMVMVQRTSVVPEKTAITGSFGATLDFVLCKTFINNNNFDMEDLRAILLACNRNFMSCHIHRR